MIQLRPSQYDQVYTLVTEMNEHYPLMCSVLDRVIEGTVYVDRMPKCKQAFVCTKDHWVYFLGEDKQSEFTDAVLELFCARHEGNAIWFGISDAWSERLDAHCTGQISNHPRYRYEFSPDIYRTTKTTPVPFEVQPIDPNNIEQVAAFSNSADVFWGGGQDFLNQSFGYVAMQKEEVVGIALIAAISRSGTAEIDVETHAEYRGRGIAKALIHRLIHQCMERDMVPKWDCMIDNEPSVRLAHYFGFQKKETYPVSFIVFQ